MMLAPRPLRAFLCPLLCVRGAPSAQEEGQYDAAVVEGWGRPGSNYNHHHHNNNYDDDHYHAPQEQTTPPMHPPRTQPPPRHRLLATGAASAALCGFRCRCCCLSVPLWRPPVLRA
ncbi:putative mucin TcSMUG S, partial [Trypanosoma cruzi]